MCNHLIYKDIRRYLPGLRPDGIFCNSLGLNGYVLNRSAVVTAGLIYPVFLVSVEVFFSCCLTGEIYVFQEKEITKIEDIATG